MQRLARLGLRICSGAQDVAPALDAAQDWLLLAVSGQADRTAVTSAVHGGGLVGAARRSDDAAFARQLNSGSWAWQRDQIRACLRVWLCVRACV